jgi:hypothetical protein
MSVQCVVLEVYSVFPLGRHLEFRGEGENTLSGNSYRMQGVNSVKAKRKGSERLEMGSGAVGFGGW